MRVHEDDGQAFPNNLPYACLRDAEVQPFVASPIRMFTGGPVLEREELRLFRHLRGGEPVDGFLPGQTYDAHLAGDYVYGGPLYRHFGHFMSELVHRIVPSQLLGLPFKFLFVNVLVPPVPEDYDALPSYIRDILTFFDLSRDDIVIVSRNTIVERLHIVQQAASLGSAPKPGYVNALRPYATRRLDALHGDVTRPTHLYVSRSALPKQGSFLGEAYLDAQFERAGYTVFRPERESVSSQMDHYRKAGRIVFPGGSACHGAELLGRRMMKNVFFFPRTPGQDYMYHRVLKPRSAACSQAELTTYLGTVSRGQDGSLMTHLGASMFDLRRMAARAEADEPDLPKDVSALGYARAALSDLIGYFAEVRRSGVERDPILTRSLLKRYGAASLALARWRLARKAASVPGRPPAAEPNAGADTPKRRVMTDREIAEYWMAAGALARPFGPFFRIALLTLQQQPYLTGMRWSELSADRTIWTVPPARIKDGAAHVVPLSEAARAVLADIPCLPGIDLVFQAKGKPLRGIAAANAALDAEVARMRQAAVPHGRRPDAVAPWAILELRRTGSARLAELGYDGLAVRRLLGFAIPPQEDESPRPGRDSQAARARMLDDWASEVAMMVEDRRERGQDAVSTQAMSLDPA